MRIDNLDVQHDPQAGRFFIQAEGEQAVLEYSLADEVMTIYHTGVPPALEGRGIGSRLVQAGLEYARAQGWQVIPECWFVAGYIQRHTAYEDLLYARMNPQRIDPRNANNTLRALLAPFDADLVIASILAGSTPGTVYVDDAAQPQAALVWFGYRVFLAGEAGKPGLVDALRPVVEAELLPWAPSFVLTADDLAGWMGVLRQLLPGHNLHPLHRQHYVCTRLLEDWRPLLPPRYTIRPVDAALLAEPGLDGLEALREEMCSERPSVEDFLEKSFGVCPLYGNEVIGWCLSEYNHDERCEVGVATAEAHRRRGLGTAISLALVEMALARGIRQVGWHCWADNLPSAALALRAGFVLDEEREMLWCEKKG